MNLIYKDSLFIAENPTIFDNDMLRRSGFAYVRSTRQWVTPFASTANKVAYNISNDIQSHLETKLKVEAHNITRSMSTYSEIEVPVPVGLSYLPYQKAGIKYIFKNANVLLADDMGLGKTIQVIGYLNLFYRTEAKKVLIICPASLKHNWARELSKWLVKEYSIGIAHGKFFPNTEIVIINYDILVKLSKQIHNVCWDILVLDECHYLKNSGAKRSREVLGYKRAGGIKAHKVLALTGTPILNKPIELFSIASYLAPLAFPNKHSYAMRYCAAVRTRWGLDTTGASNLEELQTKLRSLFMIRRKKEDVLLDLPPKIRQIIEIDPDKKCLTLIKKENGYLSDISTANLDSHDYKEIVHRMSGVKVGFEDMSKIRHEIALQKVSLCIDHIKNALTSQKKIVVFFWHREVGKALQTQFPTSSVLLSGDTPTTLRQSLVDKFQTDPEMTIFFGNIKAAGVGITLTAASLVMFLELTWVPGEIIQAEDRLHRIGQKNSVLVQHLVLAGSLDATMCKTLVAKQKVIEAVMDTEVDIELREALS